MTAPTHGSAGQAWDVGGRVPETSADPQDSAGNDWRQNSARSHENGYPQENDWAQATSSSWTTQDDLEDAVDEWDAPSESWSELSEGRWGRTYKSTSGGISARGLIALSAVAASGCAALDLALTSGRMTFFFDLCFVVICLVTTMAVRREDLFTAGVLPPLIFAGVIAVVAVVAPDAFDSAPGVNKVFLSGLASHAAGLVGGYAIALLAVASRMSASTGAP